MQGSAWYILVDMLDCEIIVGSHDLHIVAKYVIESQHSNSFKVSFALMCYGNIAVKFAVRENSL